MESERIVEETIARALEQLPKIPLNDRHPAVVHTFNEASLAYSVLNVLGYKGVGALLSLSDNDFNTLLEVRQGIKSILGNKKTNCATILSNSDKETYASKIYDVLSLLGVSIVAEVEGVHMKNIPNMEWYEAIFKAVRNEQEDKFLEEDLELIIQYNTKFLVSRRWERTKLSL